MLAHGVGGSTDLPVPLSFALIGAAWALTATFAVVALAWKTPRFDPNKPGRDLPTWITRAVDSVVLRWMVSLAALFFAVWVVVAAVFGPDGGERLAGGVLRAALGRAGGGVGDRRPGVESHLADADGISVAWHEAS